MVGRERLARTMAFEVFVLGWVAVRVSWHWIWQANIVAVVAGILVRSVPLHDVDAREDAVVDSGTGWNISTRSPSLKRKEHILSSSL